ncbi:hypothetical protein GDO81_018461 [Engystomops pustulosus]|uniref:Uncharacterized protein n=1 Tax=Engystomops pustulosus TaxID=76066 RepID=A0AAV6ZYD8_ENGPU|nr:hypothetical protein GDO81_018461 [Engystomops pustulosus]
MLPNTFSGSDLGLDKKAWTMSSGSGNVFKRVDLCSGGNWTYFKSPSVSASCLMMGMVECISGGYVTHGGDGSCCSTCIT